MNLAFFIRVKHRSGNGPRYHAWRKRIPFAFLFFAFLLFMSCAPEFSGRMPPRVMNGVLDLTEVCECPENRGPSTVSHSDPDADYQNDVPGENSRTDCPPWDFHRDGPMRLDGDWEFYRGRFLFPADFEGDSPSVKSELVHMPGRWDRNRNGHKKPDPQGYATYRLRVILPDSDVGYAIKIPEILTSSILYINGRKVYQAGSPGINPSVNIPGISTDLAIYRAEGDVLQQHHNQLDIIAHVANFNYPDAGGTYTPMFFGTEEQIRLVRERALVVDLFVISSLLVMGLYHLGLYLIRRKEPSPLYFGIFCLLIVLRASVTNEIVFLRWIPWFPWELMYKIRYISVFLSTPVFALFTRSLFPEQWNRNIINGLLVVSIAGSLVVIASPILFYRHFTVMPFSIVLFLVLLYVLNVGVRAFFAKREGAVIFILAYLALFLAVFNDILVSNGFMNGAFITPYGFFVFIVAQAYVLSRRFSGALLKVETLSGELEEKNRDLLRLDRLKDEFLAKTSHELRTPLQGIIGMADSLTNDEVVLSSGTAHRRLDMIVASGRRLSRLVNDILDFSKLRYKDIRLKPGPVNAHSVVQLQIEMLAFSMEKTRHLGIINDIPGDLPSIHADEARFTQVLQNLLSNSIKYTNEGEIRIGARVIADEMVEFSVSDTGSGIAREERSRIFEPFEQAQDDIEKSRGGSGLGLSIARSLVELQGGKLWLHESDGPGATFLFTLPVANGKTASSEYNDHGFREIPGQSPLNLQPLSAFPPPDQTEREMGDSLPDDSFVLLVDDEPVNLEVMRTYLETTPYRSILANNAEEAGRIISGGRLPACLVLDIMMPGISGLDYTRELRRTYSLSELPILLVTARTRTNDLMAGMKAGANDYLMKPFEREEFLLRVGGLVSLSVAHQDAQKNQTAVREAVKRERENINADLHDHLGASLADLKLMSSSALKNPGVERRFAEKLSELAERAHSLLRSDLLNLEDLDLLEENFADGIHLILLRRYVDAGREIIFNITEDEHPTPINKNQSATLYAVVKEMATNDIKYGEGPPEWNFFMGESEFRLDFSSLSRYRTESHGTGRGTGNIVRRLAEIGGTFQMSMDAHNVSDAQMALPISISIRLPAQP